MSTTVLIIDDDDLFVDTVSFVLEQEEHRVLKASNGADGVEAALEHLPDVILCDIHMRDGHGYAAVMALRDRSETEHIPVVMMTGRGNPYVERKSLRHGADLYLEKPFAVAELTGAVGQALRTRRGAAQRSGHVIFPSSR